MVPCAKTVPGTGEVIVEVGAVVSVDWVAGARVASGVAGCTPMSAKTLTVACCAFGSAGSPFLLPISVNDQLIVPASNTSAPLGARYSVRWWVTVAAPVVCEKSWMTDGSASVVVEARINPAGWKPLSTSVSNS